MSDRVVGVTVTGPQYNEDTFDVGDLKWSARWLPSSGWLKCDGSAISRTTYAKLFAAIVPTIGTFTVTLASPGVFTLAAHGLQVGDSIYLTTTGALPTGLAQNTLYFVSVVTDANTFQLSATRGGASINTSGAQSGVHTATFCPYGLGDGSTTFNIPDGRGRGLSMAGGVSGHAEMAMGNTEGAVIGNRRFRHWHTVFNAVGMIAGAASNFTGDTGSPNVSSASVFVGPSASPPAITDAAATIVGNLFIKYEAF